MITNARRMAMERQLAEAVVDALLAAGFELAINNGGDEDEVERTRDREKLMGGLLLADDDHIFPYRDGRRFGFVHLVYGNSGWDTLADNTTNLEEFIGTGTAVQKLINAFELE